ncbi:MAG: CHAT domain-containing protein [Planctomycetota bacterium]|nr:CHAT domain-containing protein [Planctomycetota bacterium]
MSAFGLDETYYPDESTEILFGAHREIRKRVEMVSPEVWVEGKPASVQLRVLPEDDVKAMRAEFTMLGRAGSESYEIQVFVAAQSVSVEEDMTVASIRVARDEEPAEVSWEITPERSGPLRVLFSFFCHGGYAGRMALDVEVQKEGESADSRTLQAEISIRPAGKAPDLYLMVERFPDGDSTDLCYHLYSPIDSLTCHYQEAGSIRYEESGSPESWRQKLFAPPPEESDLSETVQHYAQIGRDLYDAFFPKPLQNLYWELRERIQSIQVVSGEHEIPWEAIKPYRTQPAFEDPHLGERYAIARWFSGPAPYCEFPVAEGRVLSIDIGKREESSHSDARFLSAFSLIEYKDLDNSLKGFRAWMEDINELCSLHISCRGPFKEADSMKSLPFSSGERMEPGSISRGVELSFLNRPLVFMNSSDTGHGGGVPLDPEVWARAFLRTGASVFTGAIWSVEEDLAHEFARSFYMNLLNRQVLGHAVRLARLAVKMIGLRRGSPAWLAYVVYGDPVADANPARIR